MLQIAPSGYWCHAAHKRKPELLCARIKSDETLMPQIQFVEQANMQVCGADKVWQLMNREGTKVARCAVERRMKRLVYTACTQARSCALRRRTKQHHARRIASTASSKQTGLTSCGCRTSPKSAPRRADNTWPL